MNKTFSNKSETRPQTRSPSGDSFQSQGPDMTGHDSSQHVPHSHVGANLSDTGSISSSTSFQSAASQHSRQSDASMHSIHSQQSHHSMQSLHSQHSQHTQHSQHSQSMRPSSQACSGNYKKIPHLILLIN